MGREASGDERQRLDALFVDDSEEDAELIACVLNDGGFDVDYVRVDTRKDLVRELAVRHWDVLFSDYSLPRLGAQKTVALAQQVTGDLPVICLSGRADEDVAVQAMRAGARDFVSKERTGRLCLAVQREMHDRAERQAHRDAQHLAEERLQAARRLELVGQLAAGIAHEVNTPTQFIGDNAYFLERMLQRAQALLAACSEICSADATTNLEPLAEELRRAASTARLDLWQRQVPEAIQQIRVGAERIGKIVNGMRQLAHPGAEKKKKVDLREVVDSAVLMTKNEWKYVAELHANVAADLPQVWCVPEAICQALINLIINSAHAIESSGRRADAGPGTIMIDARARGEDCEIDVTDDGTGIAPEDLERVFDPFFTSKPIGKGTGQGLALAQATIVNQHGGTLRVESTPGVGTTFTIRLPIDERTAVPAVPSPSPRRGLFERSLSPQGVSRKLLPDGRDSSRPPSGDSS